MRTPVRIKHEGQQRSPREGRAALPSARHVVPVGGGLLAGVLGDARLSLPANRSLRATLLRAGQRAVGNRVLQGPLRAHRLQARLMVSPPGDAYEREADRVAATVTGVPEAAVQRQEAAPEDETAQARPAAGGVAAVTPQVEAGINSLRGGGRPLPAPLRDFFEPRFGADFRGVRLHTGGTAATTAAALQARAFTVGRDIVFGAGQYAPETAAGRSLLAHELTHVVQQGAAQATAAGRMDERLSRAPADGPSKEPVPAAPTPKEQEALANALMAALRGKKPEEKDQGSEAVKKVVEGFLETPTGKKIKQQALGFAFGSKGLPCTLLVGSGVLAAMVANNTSIPSVPDIPLTKNLSLQFSFQGSFQKPTGFTVGLKITLGGGESRAVEKPTAAEAALPAWSTGQKIPADLLQKWIVGLAFQEYELAGPDEEEDRRKFYLLLKEDPETVPDARLLAEALGRHILTKTAQGEKRIDFDLKHEDLWREAYKRFDRVKGFRAGLVARLRYLLDAVVAELPEAARAVERVTFTCAGRLIPLGVLKQAGKAR